MATSTATLLTRRQVAALLGLSEAELKTKDGAALHPVKGPDGSWRYPPEEVAALLRGGGDDGGQDPEGAVCASAFDLFQAGKSQTEVVVALKQTPTIVRQLRAEFDSMAGALTISAHVIAELERFTRSPLRSADQLLGVITEMPDRLREEYRRGYQAGLAEASDMGEVVDPETGARRPLNMSDVNEVARVAEQHWSQRPAHPGRGK